jgi:glucokinase
VRAGVSLLPLRRKVAHDALCVQIIRMLSQSCPVAAIVRSDLTERRTLCDLIVAFDLERISIGGKVFWQHRDWLLSCLQSCIPGQ